MSIAGLTMSTENELTPGVPAHLHTMSYPDLATTIQLNNAVSLLEKASVYGNYNNIQLFSRYYQQYITNSLK